MLVVGWAAEIKLVPCKEKVPYLFSTRSSFILLLILLGLDIHRRNFGHHIICPHLSNQIPYVFSVMRDVYSMLGPASGGSFDQTKKMFEMMDKDGDNKITEKEFIRASLEDPELTRMLSCRN